MRLFEAILEANHRAVAGDQDAGLHPDDFADELPVVALTCIDARLNKLFPAVLGVPEEKFIWLRNSGNIIFDPMSSMTRTLAMACAIKGGKEIAIIGHTDCLVCKTTTIQLLERFKALGVERHVLPDNVNEFFGMFSSERANVIKACDIVRHSPLIGPKIPVHGLVVDIQTGKLEWIVNGYETFATMGDRWTEVVKSAGQTVDALNPNPRNPRTHSKRQLRQIADSIQEFGFTNPILVDKDNVVIAGHGRLEAAKLLGMSQVPTIRLENLTPDQIRAYVIAENRLAEKAGWDN